MSEFLLESISAIGNVIDELHRQRDRHVATYLSNGGTVADLAKVDRIAAIKAYRDAVCCSLTAAREYVDSLA